MSSEEDKPSRPPDEGLTHVRLPFTRIGTLRAFSALHPEHLAVQLGLERLPADELALVLAEDPAADPLRIHALRALVRFDGSTGEHVAVLIPEVLTPVMTGLRHRRAHRLAAAARRTFELANAHAAHKWSVPLRFRGPSSEANVAAAAAVLALQVGDRLRFMLTCTEFTRRGPGQSLIVISGVVDLAQHEEESRLNLSERPIALYATLSDFEFLPAGTDGSRTHTYLTAQASFGSTVLTVGIASIHVINNLLAQIWQDRIDAGLVLEPAAQRKLNAWRGAFDSIAPHELAGPVLSRRAREFMQIALYTALEVTIRRRRCGTIGLTRPVRSSPDINALVQTFLPVAGDAPAVDSPPGPLS